MHGERRGHASFMQLKLSTAIASQHNKGALDLIVYRSVVIGNRATKRVGHKVNERIVSAL